METQTLAASKAIKKAQITAARREVEIGEHDVDFWMRITGSIKVGDDYETAPTVAIPYKKAFAALCRISGCTGKTGIARIRQAMEEAFDETETTAKDVLSRDVGVDDIERDVVNAMLGGLPKLSCKGKVTTKLVWEISETRDETE